MRLVRVLLCLGFALVVGLLVVGYVPKQMPKWSDSPAISPAYVIAAGVLVFSVFLVFYLIRSQKSEQREYQEQQQQEKQRTTPLDEAKEELRRLLTEANRRLIEEYTQGRPARVLVNATNPEDRAKQELLDLIVQMNRDLLLEICLGARSPRRPRNNSRRSARPTTHGLRPVTQDSREVLAR